VKKYIALALPLLLALVLCLPTKSQTGTGVASAYPTITQNTNLPPNTEEQIASTGVVNLPASGNPIYVVHALADIVVPANSPDTLIMFRLYSVDSTDTITGTRSQIGQAFFVRLTPTTTAQGWTAVTFAVDLSQGQDISVGFTGAKWILTATVFGTGSGAYSNGEQRAVIQAA